MSRKEIEERIRRLEEKKQRLIKQLEENGVNLDFLKEDYKDAGR